MEKICVFLSSHVNYGAAACEAADGEDVINAVPLVAMNM